MKCCTEIPKRPNGLECSNNLKPIKAIQIQGDKYYVDGKYWGKIIEKTDNYFKVECDNGNKYMKGQIITVNFNLNTLYRK